MALGKKKEVGVSSDGSNAAQKNQQVKRLAMGAACVIGFVFILSQVTGKKEKTVTVSDIEASQRLQEASSRNPSDKETFESLSNQVQGQAQVYDEFQRYKTDDNKRWEENQKTLKAIREEIANANELAESEEIEDLKTQITNLQKKYEDLSTAPINTRGSSRLQSEDGGGQDYSILPPTTRGSLRGNGAGEQAEPLATSREVVVLDLGGGDDIENAILNEVEDDINGNLSEAAEPDVFATEDYVPPNAFAPATILVGVDASTGQRAQNDPLNATFLITGAASHVVKDGILETTDLEGCIVNGAAFGDISSERVFIRLARMTCPLSNGDVAVQDVQGHVTENGKAGVRGQVISRVGDKINRAAVAGLFSGLGGALGNAGRQSIGFGSGGGNGLVQDIPNAEELAVASVGSGVQNAANTLTEYYVERARAIEPVVSMPRGIDVELVFISGFKARPTLEASDDE